MVRIDMSEFMEQHSVARLIGAPPGYVGYEEGGRLTEAVRRRPYAVILFDEIEKAHRDVFNVLLQVLDDGRLTDGQGRTVNFKNTVIAMTSNIGSAEIQKLASREAPEWEVEAAVKELLKLQFRPEFLNRIDEVMLFHSLNKEQLTKIVDVQLESLRKRLALRNLKLSLTAEAKKLLAEEGYDPTYGARPLKRVIQQQIENPLASKILNGEFAEGTTIRRGCQGLGHFQFYCAEGRECRRWGETPCRRGSIRIARLRAAGVIHRNPDSPRRHGGAQAAEHARGSDAMVAITAQALRLHRCDLFQFHPRRTAGGGEASEETDGRAVEGGVIPTDGRIGYMRSISPRGTQSANHVALLPGLSASNFQGVKAGGTHAHRHRCRSDARTRHAIPDRSPAGHRC